MKLHDQLHADGSKMHDLNEKIIIERYDIYLNKTHFYIPDRWYY